MARRASVLFAASLAACVCQAAFADEAADTAKHLAQQAANDGWANDFVRDLTTDVGQRLAGTEAQVRAADWAEARLKASGFANVHREPFPMEAWVRGAEEGTIVSPVRQHLVLTALGGSVATPPGGIDAEIVVFRRYADLLAAAPGSLDGKIAVVTEAMVPRAGWQRLRSRQPDPPRRSGRGPHAAAPSLICTARSARIRTGSRIPARPITWTVSRRSRRPLSRSRMPSSSTGWRRRGRCVCICC